MANVKRTVEVAINVTGANQESLKKIANAFISIGDSVLKASNAVSSLKTNLESVKAPAGLTKITDEIKEISKLKVPNILQLAQGFERLSKIKPPDLGTFAKEADRFSKIKVPNIFNLAKGIEKLSESVVSVGDAGSKLRVLQRNLKRFTEIKVPNIQGLVKSLQQLINLNIDTVAKKIKDLVTAVDGLSRTGKFDHFAKFASDLRQVARASALSKAKMTELRSLMQQTGNTVRSLSVRMRTLSDRVRNYFQFTIASGLVQSFRQAVMESVVVMGQYDQSLKNLQAIMQATSDEVREMGIAIENVASTTKFSTTEVAEGMQILGQAGLSAKETVSTIQAVADLATGTLTDMATSVDLITTALRVFGIQAEDSAHVADVFANAVNGSKLTIDKLRTALNYVGPIAANVGVSFEETSAAMMTLANSGQRASTIGTGLRRMFAELVDPSKKMQEAAAAAGISLSELAPDTNNLSDVLRSLSVVISDTDVAFDLFGKRGAAAALTLTNDVTAGFDSMLESSNQFGTASSMAATQMEGLGVSFKNLQDKIKLIAVSLGKAGVISLLKVLIDMAKSLADGIVWLIDNTLAPLLSILKPIAVIFKELPSYMQLVIVALGVLTIKFGLLARVINSFRAAQIAGNFAQTAAAASGAATSVSALTGALAALRVGLATLLTPVGLVIAAIGAVATAYALLTENSDKQISTFEKIRQEIDNNITSVDSYTKQVADLANKELSDSELLEFMNTLTDKFPELSAEIYNAEDPIEAAANGLKNLKKALQDQKYEESIKGLDGYVDKLKDAQQHLNATKMFKGLFRDKNQWAKDIAVAESEVKKASGRVSKIVADAFRRGEKIDWKEMFDVYMLTNQMKSIRDNIIEEANKINERTSKIELGSAFHLYGVVPQWDKELKGAHTVLEDWLNGDIKGTNERFNKLLEGINRETVQGFFNQQKALITEMKKAEKELSGDELYAKRKEISDKAIKLQSQINNSLAKDNSTYRITQYTQLVKWQEKQLARRTSGVEDERKLESIRQAIYIEGAKKLESILNQTDSEDAVRERLQKQRQVYELANKDRESSHLTMLTNIEQREVNGVISHEQAQATKLTYTLDFYDRAYQAAVKYRDQININDNPKEYAKRHEIVLKAEERFQKERLKITKDYASKVRDVQEDIIDVQDDRSEEIQEHADNIEQIEEELGETRRDINEKTLKDIQDAEEDCSKKIKEINDDLVDDLNDIDDERAQNAKDLRLSILGIEEDTSDKIRKVNQRGMSDREKDRDNEAAAYEKMAKARSLQQEAEQSGNVELAKQAQDMIKSAQDLAVGLEDASAAKEILYSSEDALKANAIIQKNIKDSEIEKKAIDAIIEAEKKRRAVKEETNNEINNIIVKANKEISEAEKASAIKVKLEDSRHAKEMANIDKEMAKLNEKLELYKKFAQAAAESVLGDATIPTNSDSPDSNRSTKALQDVKKMAEEAVNAVSSVGDRSQETAEKVGSSLSKSLGDASKKASKGFEDFIVVTKKSGDQVITTAATMKQGMTGLSNVVKIGPLASLKQLGEEANSVSSNSIDIQVKTNVEDTIGRFKELTGELSSQKVEMGHFITDEALSRIDETKNKISTLFEGLEASSPEQKLSDMITLFDSLSGKLSDNSMMDFFKEIQEQAAKLKEPVEIELQLDGGEATVAVLGDATEKFDKLKEKFESNPFDLSESLTVDEIIVGLGEVEGLVDAVKEKAREKIQLELDTDKAKQDVDNLEQKTPEKIEVSVEADTKQAEQELDSLEGKKVVTTVEITAKANPEGTVPEIVGYVKGQLASIEESNPTVVVLVDKTELDTLIDSLKGIEDSTEISINVSIKGLSDIQSLIKWLEQVQSMNPTDVKAAANVHGENDVVSLKQAIDSLVNKTVKIIASVTGIDRVRNLRREIDKLKDKTVTITTRYKTTGNPPSEAKSTGGEIQGFHNGGEAFPRLVSRFINKGSGVKDDVRALLMKGEFVHKVSAVKKYGRRFMEMVNAGLYPISLAKKAVSNKVSAFKNGGMVQNFNSGGSVIPKFPMRKKLEELFAGSNFHIENLSLSNVFPAASKKISTSLGLDSMHRMHSATKEAVQELSTGGTINKSYKSISQQQFEINQKYNQEVQKAKKAGQDELAKVLAEEKEKIAEINEELSKALLELKENYDKFVAKRRASRKSKIDGATASYNEKKSDELQSYQDSVQDDTLDRTRSVQSYEENKQKAAASLAEKLAKLAERYQKEKQSKVSNIQGKLDSLKESASKVNEVMTRVANSAPNDIKYTPRGKEIPDFDKIRKFIRGREQHLEPFSKKEFDKLAESLNESLEDYRSKARELKSEIKVNYPSKTKITGKTPTGPFRFAAGSSGGSSNYRSYKELFSIDAERVAARQAKSDLVRSTNEEKKEYTEKLQDIEKKFSEKTEDYQLKVQRRDRDHTQKMQELLNTLTATKNEENNSFFVDMKEAKADYLANVEEEKSKHKDSIQSTKSEIQKKLEEINESTGANISNIKRGEVDPSLAVSTLPKDDEKEYTSKFDTSSEGANIVQEKEALTLKSNSILDISELLKRLGIPRFNVGGFVNHIANSIPGKDSILAALTPGEYVLKEPTVRALGVGFLDNLNNLKFPVSKFNLGGLVGNSLPNENSTVHKLALTINDKEYSALQGDPITISDLLSDLSLASLRT